MAELRARIGTQVRASRQRQGLGPHVTDPATLDRLATRVLEPVAAWAELATDGHDHPNPDRPAGRRFGTRARAGVGELPATGPPYRPEPANNEAPPCPGRRF